MGNVTRILGAIGRGDAQAAAGGASNWKM